VCDGSCLALTTVGAISIIGLWSSLLTLNV